MKSNVRVGARSVSERSPKATSGCTRPNRRAARLRFALQLCSLLVLAACSQPNQRVVTGDTNENGDIKEHRDQWHPNEAQSDFIDIGKQAGIEWLSFVPEDQREYPEYFEGLDRDEKRRLRLAPKGSDEQVLLQFDLPEGSKLWPVDWYGTELMAASIEGDIADYSIAIADAKTQDMRDVVQRLVRERAKAAEKPLRQHSGYPASTTYGYDIDGKIFMIAYVDNKPTGYTYGATVLTGRTGSWLLVCEGKATSKDSNASPPRSADGVLSVLGAISLKRELALEGSPKHKCTSSLEEQLRGTLRFPDGTLKLSISEGQLVRKVGGDSTIQIDGNGAEPWILIRRLDETKIEGDLRVRLRHDTTFHRRLDAPGAKFSAGYIPEDAALPIVCFDYDDNASENNLLGVMKAGNELLTFEVVSNGIRDGDMRRALKRDALRMLAGAQSEPATEAPEFKPLIGWNVGTMGQDK